MSRMTLRLPDSLHSLLAQQAQREGVSLNQYLVYSLTRLVSIEDLQGQLETFNGLLHRFPEAEGEASLQKLLAARES